MDLTIEQSWQEIFARAAEAKAVKRHDEEMRQFYETRDHERAEKLKAKEKEEKEEKQLEEIIATDAQLAAFNQHLDAYDTETVQALMENREALDRLGGDLRKMEENAYVLPDGRRVFKTTDGRRVFDEHGGEVPAGTIDPQMIDDRHTRWEPLKAAKEAEDKLLLEQHDLHAFQVKVDEARSRAGKGDMTKNNLDALDADLKASAPPAIREKLGLAQPNYGEKSRPDDPAIAQTALADDPSRRVQPRPAPF